MDLMEFLTILGANPRKAAELKERPIEVLDEAGLPEADKQTILSGDPVAIHNAVARAASPMDPAPVVVTSPTIYIIVIAI